MEKTDSIFTGLNLFQKIVFLMIGFIARFMQLFGIFVVAFLLTLLYGHVWLWVGIVAVHTLLDIYRHYVMKSNGWGINSNTLNYEKKEPEKPYEKPPFYTDPYEKKEQV